MSFVMIMYNFDRVIWIFSLIEIEDVEIGLLDDYKFGNVVKGMNGIGNGI